MKTNKLIIFLLALVTSISFTSCVEDGDFTVPNSLGNEENQALQTLLNTATYSEISVANLKGLFVNGQATQITSDIYVKGYVSSSDQSGNFYKEFFIQDAPSNPTAAIKIVTEFVDSYNKYNFGREVYINLKGLYIGEVRSGDGVIVIGGDGNTDDEIENLSINQTEAAILRSANTETIVPLDVKLTQITESHVGMFVKADNAHFPTSLAGQPYHDNNNRFDTQRTLESCEGFGFATFILETSAFADFGSVPMPAGGGSISAVVSKTFDGSDVVLALNNVSDVDMTGSKCTPLNINDFTTILDEPFDNVTTNWTAYSIVGSQTWGTTSFGNPGTAARMSGFSGGARDNEDWLVSNVLNVSSAANIFVTFETVKRFSGDDLELYMSTDYTGGDPTANGTWTQVNFVLDQNVNSWSSWTPSGAVDLSAAAGGNLYIAFKYTSDTNEAATYQIDNLKVLTN